MKFEYGNANFHTALLHVNQMQIHTDKVIVKLGTEQTCCKAKDRAETPEEKAVACCAPVVLADEAKPKVNLSDLIASGNNSCTPGSGCC